MAEEAPYLGEGRLVEDSARLESVPYDEEIVVNNLNKLNNGMLTAIQGMSFVWETVSAEAYINPQDGTIVGIRGAPDFSEEGLNNKKEITLEVQVNLPSASGTKEGVMDAMKKMDRESFYSEIVGCGGLDSTVTPKAKANIEEPIRRFNLLRKMKKSDDKIKLERGK